MHVSGLLFFQTTHTWMPFQVLAMNRFHTHRRIYAMVRNWPERGALILVDDKVDAIMTQHKNDFWQHGTN